MNLLSTEAQLRSLSPGPERFMTMNLMSSGPSTVTNAVTIHGRTVRRLKTRDHHSTFDVDGAQTFNKTSVLTNKPNFYNISDIGGTKSMRLHKDTNKPDRALYLDDIEGSKPRNKVFFRTKRCVNPLVPEYTLPSFVPAPTVIPKFTRDSFDVSDIEGTKSRPLYRFNQRKNTTVDDIEGAQAGWKPRHVRARKEAPPLGHSLDVQDITGGGFRTRRNTNPLEPTYRVNGMDVADDPVKSRPRALPKARDSPFYPLTTADIEGAQVGWRPMPQMNPPLEARRHFRNTNFMGDIPGAQADTVKHSMSTNRQVNPLNPVYVSLDGGPLANPHTPLYKEPAWKEAEEQLNNTIRVSETTTQMAEAAGSKTRHQEGSREGRQSSDVGRHMIETRSVAGQSSTESPSHLQNKVGEKDRLIQQLEEEVKMLRRSRRQPLPSTSAKASTVFSKPGSALVSGELHTKAKGETSGENQVPQRALSVSSPSQLRGGLSSGGAPHSAPTAGEGRVSTAAMVIRSRGLGDEAGSRAERLVLRSANGTPRVPLTPSERRLAQEYREEVGSVRDLV
ncbi:unnamed protein product [Discosporangium mesarthrocarpum]